jgi:carbonic anhydrase
MSDLADLLARNRAWADDITQRAPDFFSSLVAQQTPRYLWIGCSDSRVPANQITGLAPGDLFVHRNVSNLVVHTDLNCLSVLQYAVDVLQVSDVLVVGHYGCGGVKAAFTQVSLGLIDNWLRHIQDVRDRHEALLRADDDVETTVNRLCELNVIEQVRNVSLTTIVRDAWQRGHQLAVHGWIYGVGDGLLHDLGCTIAATDEVGDVYARAIGLIASRVDAPG